MITRDTLRLLCEALNVVKAHDRPVVTQDMRLADALQSGIGSNELAMAIFAAVGEEVEPELVHPEMTFGELAQALTQAGHEPVRQFSD